MKSMRELEKAQNHPGNNPFDDVDNTDWYSVGEDDGTLHHNEWPEALGEFFDDTAQADVHIKQQCDDLAPLTIYSWKKKELSICFAEDMVERFIAELQDADGMAESWWEEYGDPDGDHPPIDKDTSTEKLKPLIENITLTLHNFLLENAHVWQCEVSGKRVFSTDDLEEFAKLNYEEEWNKPE